MRRYIVPAIFGIGGLAILLSLGFWQLRRLEWKLDMIAGIEARIHDPAVALPATLDPEQDRYMPVEASGAFTGEVVRVLASERGAGTGVRIIAVLETQDGRRVLADRGFLSDADLQTADLSLSEVTVQGNLIWPQDSDSFTPAPDLTRGLWFSRDVAPIAAHLATETVMIAVRRETTPVPATSPQPAARPVTIIGVKNDHLSYAITWFLLAAVWVGMTAFLMWRIRRNMA